MTQSVTELRNSAESFRKAKNYTAALPPYKAIWNDYHGERTKWDGWGYALCLNHFKKYDEALKICKETYELDKSFKYIKSQYAWAAYQIHILKFDLQNGDLNELIKHGNGILKLTNDSNGDLARKETVFKIIDILEDKGKWDEIIEWTSKLDVSNLSIEKYSHTLPNGKNILLPSPKEKWYSKKTKALEKNEKYAECLKLTSEALQIFGMDIWLTRRKAICLGKTGKPDEAIKMLKDLIVQKPEWFIYKDIADLYYMKNDLINALKYAYESSFHAIRNPKQENLWELYFTISQILKKQNSSDLAKKYCLLSGLLRLEQQWKIPQELQQYASQLGVKYESTTKSTDIIRELSKDWISNKYSDAEKQNGFIKNLLGTGKSGFISSDNGKDYFFMIKNFNGKQDFCKPNAKVSFFTEMSFDKKKNQESEIAVNISLI
jgi:tetratricopeptide (TPR) repeat protein